MPGDFLLQNLLSEVAHRPNNSDFRRSAASLPQPNSDHKWLVRAEFRGLVLNVPLSSVICR
jgi:hypothetical protein